MAFQQPAVFRQPQRAAVQSQDTSSFPHPQSPQLEQSQEWVLFAPSQAESSTDRTRTDRTVGLSHISDLGSLNSITRSGRPQSSLLEEDVTEDGDLDSLDDGLHAFREPPVYRTHLQQADAPLLPTHDGLGTFPASSPLVLEQLWQHEQHNPKRKHEGHHRRPSSVQRRLDTIEDFEAQANEEKRIRIEKWRLDQSQALLEEIEKATRRKARKESLQSTTKSLQDGVFGSTPRQSDYLLPTEEERTINEPFWRKITRKFIRDVIGIDEPLLSVILGESLPGEYTPRPSSPLNLPPSDEVHADNPSNDSWRDKLLQRIAKELGVLVHQLSPHPGAFTSYVGTAQNHDYAGIPIRQSPKIEKPEPTRDDTENFASNLSPNFPPTMRDPAHAESWGFEDEPVPSSSSATLNLRQEREYWERELDVKMVFRYLATKFAGSSQKEDPVPTSQTQNDASATRAAIIRQHHPLIARTQKSPVRVRRDSRMTRRPTSSCAGESVKSGHRASALRSGSSRNYWDIGGSAGSGSLMASGGLMGAWGEA